MLVQPQSLAQHLVLPPLKNFLLWSATLAARSLAFGLPLVLPLLAIATLGSALAPSRLPSSQILVLLERFAALNLLFIFVGAIACSLKGLRPHQLRWLQRPAAPMACALSERRNP